jgi:hypothetical protein
MKPSPISLLLLLSAWWLCPLPAPAQERPPLPAKKMPAELPASAAWEITFKYPGEATDAAKDAEDAPDATNPAAAEAEARPVKVVITRTGDLIREQTSWSDRKKTEKWIYRTSLAVEEDAATGKLFRVPPVSLVNDSGDYAKGSFSELAWIGPGNYKGVRPVNERPCFIFTAAPGEATNPLVEELDAGIPAELRATGANTDSLAAAIDTETLLPVSFSNGRVVKNYRILRPPDAPLALPPKFAGVFDEWIKRIEEANRLPGKP